VARTIGRKALFFGALALLGLVMVYPTPPEFRWVTWFVAALSGFWTILLAVEDLTTPVYPPVPREDRGGDVPFAPPPPPWVRHGTHGT
jgi:hypothetical protein